MSHGDLPLFAWKPPVQFLPFPAKAQVGEARLVIEKLSNRTEKAQQTYWNRYVRRLRNRLSAIGIEPDAIQHEVDAFRTLVEQESTRMYLADQEHHQRPDGAA